MSTKRVVLSDVAKLAGVSKATVSRYLNHSLTLPQQTATRIEKAIEQTHYQRNTLARRLSKGGSETIGLVIPDITNPFFAQLADAAESTAAEYGYSLVLCISRNDYRKEHQFIQWLDSCQVDGLLFITNKPKHSAELKKLISGRKDIVLVDEDIKGVSSSKVFADNVQGGLLATRRLIKAGHRKIAYIGGPERLMSVKERFLGYRSAIEEAGITYKNDWVCYGDYARHFGHKAIQYLMQLEDIPTSVFAGSDYIALGVLDGLKDLGITIPDMLSIAGYDDAYFADLLSPRISTVRQPFQEMGKTAVELLISQITQENIRIKNVRLPVEWVERESIQVIAPF
ncbi:LacI family DNA-binding transcriptional regulator [Psychromonas sp.]|uniref:LacI family DNA-binding transcriptional regulator n=1 Tax=Psychromonas sp. TaxID=1884585 RepID=UPI003A96DEAE